MSIENIIKIEFDNLKSKLSSVLLDFDKYLEFLEKKGGGVEYSYSTLNGVEYVHVIISHMEEDKTDLEDLGKLEEVEEVEEVEEEKKYKKVIDEEYTIISFSKTTIEFYKKLVIDSKSVVSDQNILDEALTVMQSKYLTIAIAFEATLSQIESVLNPVEEKDFFKELKNMIDKVSL